MTEFGAHVVAIDGPSGSGKSTVARGVARQLGLPVLDTGAMYRAVTLAVLDAGADLHDEVKGAAIATACVIEVEQGVTRLNGRDVSAEIRGPEVTKSVSAVSAQPEVRRVLVDRQRTWLSRHGGGVVEGRDIGSVVVPDAVVKVYLVASHEERARRRQRDESDTAHGTTVDAVQSDMERRDRLDAGRIASPMRPAEDALVLDTTTMTIDEVIAEIVARYRATRT